MRLHTSEYKLGGFGLTFGRTGKLRSLRLPTGGQFLHQGSHILSLGNGRTFEVSGWDECFPTIEPHQDSPTMGDLIILGPEFGRRNDCVEEVWQMPKYVAARLFVPHGNKGIEVLFSVENTGNDPMEFLWASHALLSVEGLLEVVLPDGHVLRDFSLNGTCSKSFVTNREAVCINRIEGPITMSTDQPWRGVWLNRGGWPTCCSGGFACVGIEATNANADTPTGASIPPGGMFHGKVTVQVM
jgi:hypothetical protein